MNLIYHWMSMELRGYNRCLHYIKFQFTSLRSYSDSIQWVNFWRAHTKTQGNEVKTDWTHNSSTSEKTVRYLCTCVLHQANQSTGIQDSNIKYLERHQVRETESGIVAIEQNRETVPEHKIVFKKSDNSNLCNMHRHARILEFCCHHTCSCQTLHTCFLAHYP